MLFAKMLLLVTIVAVIVLSLAFRIRAAVRARRARWEAERELLDRELRGGI